MTNTFTFDSSVAAVFPDMVSRSVPGYAAMLAMIELMSARFSQADTNLYDLGCSLGAASLRIQNAAKQGCTIHAVDNSAAMLEKMRELLPEHNSKPSDRCPIEIHLADVRGFPIENASLVVMNLTLQFLPLEDRQQILQTIYDGMLPDAALVLSEKIRFDDPVEQHLQTELHHDFKRANGYSDMEIAEKRDAIENFLVPETVEAHLTRLKQIGFQAATVWFQCFNFVSIVCTR